MKQPILNYRPFKFKEEEEENQVTAGEEVVDDVEPGKVEEPQAEPTKDSKAILIDFLVNNNEITQDS